LLVSPAECYLNTDQRKFESSQKDESRAQLVDSSKAYRKLELIFVLIDKITLTWQGFLGVSRYPFNMHSKYVLSTVCTCGCPAGRTKWPRGL